MALAAVTGGVGDAVVVVALLDAVGRNSPLCSAMPFTLSGVITNGPPHRGPIRSHLTAEASVGERP
jgi:hypothetical protein